jgi:hypothetical protein
VLGLDPYGILFAFGVLMIAGGFYYRTPFPVQPMKAIGAAATTQAAQTALVTAGAVYAAGLVTGTVWLILGFTGLTQKAAQWVPGPVLVGVILGLGFGFMLNGAELMAADWWISGALLLLTLVLLTNRVIPAMFLLLIGGAALALYREPGLWGALAETRPALRLPSLALGEISWGDWVVGAVVLALPQIPLTLGNAILAVTEENNRLFADRPVTERKVSISTGLMNLVGGLVGGIPMCHGAGGMAGHVRFGARTGGSLVILGTLLLVLALFFSDSVGALFQMVPREVLGVILFLTGAQLALGSCDFSKDKGERFATLVTAGLALWNVGLAFIVGLACYHLLKRGWIRL